MSRLLTLYDESESRSWRTKDNRRDSTATFMGIPGLGAVTNMRLVDEKSKQLQIMAISDTIQFELDERLFRPLIYLECALQARPLR